MMIYRRRVLACVLPVVPLTMLVGCQTPQRTAREEADQRWRAARAQVKFQLAADQLAVGNLSGAAGELAEAERLVPNSPQHVPLQARIWLADGKVAQAGRLLERARTESTPQAEVEYLLGIVRQQQQRWDEALDAFQRAADLDDQQVAYVVAAAQTLLQLGRPAETLDYLLGASARFGWTNAYLAALAECHEQLGDWSAAASAWQRVAYADDASSALRRRLADALFRARRHLEAALTIEDLLEAESGEAMTEHRLMLAECYLSLGRHADASGQARTILNEQGGNVRALRLLARAQGAQTDYPQALRTARRALAIEPNDIRTLELVAALAWRVKNQDLAAVTAQKLLERDPTNPVGARIRDQLRYRQAPGHRR